MRKEKYLLNEFLEVFEDNLVSIIFFGSRIRKNYENLSDLDVLILISDYANINVMNIQKRFSKFFGIRLDVTLMSCEDFLRNVRSLSPLISTLVLGKKILFDKGDFFRMNFNNLLINLAKEEIKYFEGGVLWDLSKEARDLEKHKKFIT